MFSPLIIIVIIIIKIIIIIIIIFIFERIFNFNTFLYAME